RASRSRADYKVEGMRWSEDIDDLVSSLEVDPSRGLSTSEAERRLGEHGPNQLRRQAVMPRWRKLLLHFADPLVYLLIGAVVVSLIVWLIEGRQGWPVEALVIVSIVVANGLLGYLQGARAE